MELKYPFLSIIVPVYKVEQYLDCCIKSILAQAFKDWELILVDDGSPDACPQICDNYAASECRIRVIHQKNRGLSAARNAGIDIASGQYITFVDADDEIEKNTYQSNIKIIIENSDIDVLQYPMYSCIEQRILSAEIQKIESPKKIFLACCNNYPINFSVCNKIFRKTVFSYVRFPEGHQYEDMYFIIQLSLYINSFQISNAGCYIYNENFNSIIHTPTISLQVDFLYNYVLILKRFNLYPDCQYEYLHRWVALFIRYAQFLLIAPRKYKKTAKDNLESTKPLIKFLFQKQIVTDIIWFTYIEIVGLNFAFSTYIFLHKRKHIN